MPKVIRENAIVDICPFCNSDNVYKDCSGPVEWLDNSSYYEEYVCHQCGEEFRQVYECVLIRQTWDNDKGGRDMLEVKDWAESFLVQYPIENKGGFGLFLFVVSAIVITLYLAFGINWN